jgi:hypothetical protein
VENNSTEFFAQLHYSNITKAICHHSEEIKLTTFLHTNMLCILYGMPTPTKTTNLAQITEKCEYVGMLSSIHT